jgi:hypothetical protein
MLSYAKCSKRPRVLRSLTGLPPLAFARLRSRFGPCWAEAERRRLDRPDRVHAVGAGHPYALKDHADKLLLFLTLCRHGLTYEFAGFLFGMDNTNARRLVLRMAPAVEAAADPQLAGFLADARDRRLRDGAAVGSWEEFLAACPELEEVAVDTCEHVRLRPGSRRGRRRFYSGKAKRFTLKTGVVVSRAGGGRILHVTGCHPGPTADKALYEKERLHELIPERTKQFLDSGFQGLAAAHPGHDLRLPHKRKSPGRKGRGKKGPPLTRGQKRANTLRSRRRVVVEHALARIRGYRLMADRWRSAAERHDPLFRAVAAVTNLRLVA